MTIDGGGGGGDYGDGDGELPKSHMLRPLNLLAPELFF